MCCRFHSFCGCFSLRKGAITTAVISLILCIMIVSGFAIGAYRGMYGTASDVEIMVGVLLGVSTLPFIVSTFFLIFGIFKKWPSCILFWLIAAFVLMISSVLSSVYLFFRKRYTIGILSIILDSYLAKWCGSAVRKSKIFVLYGKKILYLWCVTHSYYRTLRWDQVLAERGHLPHSP